MTLRSDDLLDQLDLRLSRMQAQLPSNPDTRPLPFGWVEHFDPHRKVWYYIDLAVAHPRATFSHPTDEATGDGEESTQSCSSSSRSHTPSRTRIISRSTPIGSTRVTTAQQLYASSLSSGSKIPRSVISSLESVSTSNTGSNSDPDQPRVVSTSSERSFAQNHPGKGDPSSTASPSPAFPVHPNSHDPRKFFDITRLAQGTRKYRHDEASRSNGSSQTVLPQLPSTSQSPLPTHPASSGESSAGVDGSTLTPTNHPTSTPTTSGLISPDAQALYNPSVVSKPLSPSRAAIVADRHKYSISVPLTGGVSRVVSPERDRKRPQPIQIIRPSDNYKLYTAVTEDETLKVVPNSDSATYPNASGVTEDNLLVLPSHPTPSATAQSPTINVLDVQNPDTPPPILHETKPKFPVRTLSISRLHIKKKKKPVDDTLILQQPRPVRPLGDLPAHLNDQASEDAKYYAENFKGKGKERKSYGFSSIFETIERLANRESGIIIKEYA